MRKIPKKNYLMFLVMVIFVVGFVFHLCGLYESRGHNKYVSPMNNFITEVKVDDIENHIMENSIVVIYVSDKKDDTLEEREEGFKKILTEYNIQQYFVYLDMSQNAEDVSEKFKEYYNDELDYEKLPILVSMIDGKVVGTYNEENYDEAKIIAFLKNNEVIEID
jgi:hypothetical protein